MFFLSNSFSLGVQVIGTLKSLGSTKNIEAESYHCDVPMQSRAQSHQVCILITCLMYLYMCVYIKKSFNFASCFFHLAVYPKYFLTEYYFRLSER